MPNLKLQQQQERQYENVVRLTADIEIILFVSVAYV